MDENIPIVEGNDMKEEQSLLIIFYEYFWLLEACSLSLHSKTCEKG